MTEEGLRPAGRCLTGELEDIEAVDQTEYREAWTLARSHSAAGISADAAGVVDVLAAAG